MWLEYPDAITEPLKDQHPRLPGLVFRSAVARGFGRRGDGGAVAVGHPLVTLGGMTASTWPRQLSLKRGHVFAYVMKTTGTRTTRPARRPAGIPLLAHLGPRRLLQTRGGRAGLGNVCACGCAIGRRAAEAVLSAPAEACLASSPVGLPLMALKQSEDEKGFVFRVCDFAGVGGSLKLTLPKPARETFTCDLVEMHAVKQDAHGKSITTPLKPFAPATVKVQFR